MVVAASTATIHHSVVPFPPSGSNPVKPSIHAGQTPVTIVAIARRAERTISIRALSTTHLFLIFTCQSFCACPAAHARASPTAAPALAPAGPEPDPPAP